MVGEVNCTGEIFERPLLAEMIRAAGAAS